jgi:glycosyltransferase involved in cell wall biosynthesis
MKILYLYSEVMGYTMATVRALVKAGAEVHIVHWNHKKLTHYQVPSYSNIYIYERSAMDFAALKYLATDLDPEITVLSGWMDNDYLRVARHLRKREAIVITGLDGQWQGTLRQRIASISEKFGYLSRYYSHCWVAGNYQYEYARRLGFHKDAIVFDLLSADLTLFQSTYQNRLSEKQNHYPHRFLYIGRFEAIKGLEALLEAWRILGQSKKDWELHLIGNGSLQSRLSKVPGIVVQDFMQPEELIQEVAKAGCFVLPSRREPWGVVVHELAAAGLPLILSNIVGAASTFLIPGLNGYTFKVNDPQSLAKKMKQIINTSDNDLAAMAAVSHQLSNRVTPQTSAANLLSLLYR